MTKFGRLARIGCLTVAGILSACSGSNATDDGGTEADVGIVSFAGQIQPMLNAHCVSCHGPSLAQRGVRMDSYAAVMKQLSGAVSLVTSGSMPPGGMASSLQNLFKAWADQGAKNN